MFWYILSAELVSPNHSFTHQGKSNKRRFRWIYLGFCFIYPIQNPIQRALGSRAEGISTSRQHNSGVISKLCHHTVFANWEFSGVQEV